MLGCLRSAWTKPCRSEVTAVGRTSAPTGLLPVDDDREVNLTHVGHRHLTSMLCTEECRQMAAGRGGKIAGQAARQGILGAMPARLACPVTHCFRRSGRLTAA